MLCCPWITSSDLLCCPTANAEPLSAHHRGTHGAADAPTGGALASGSAALLGLFIQVQQTHKMKVRPRSVLLRKSPSLFLRKRKTNIFVSLRRRGGVWAWILLERGARARSSCSQPSTAASTLTAHEAAPAGFSFSGSVLVTMEETLSGSFSLLNLSVPKGRPSATSLLPNPSRPEAQGSNPPRQGVQTLPGKAFSRSESQLKLW